MNLREWRPAFAFSIQMWLSATLSLGIAFLLQLDSPYWAPIAACIVSQPAPGMAISKAIYRLFGSILGAAMGIVLIALFVQTPGLFIVMLGAWIGLCTLASNLLRNFRAYGAVLAGYTAAIVALDTYNRPDSVFDIAVARASCTVIGILCAVLVTNLLARHRAKHEVMEKLRTALARLAERLALPFDSSMKDRIAIGRRTVEMLISLDPEIDFAAAEDSGFRIHANGARILVMHLFEAISARRALEARIQSHPGELGGDLHRLVDRGRETFASLSTRLKNEELPDLTSEVQSLRDEAATLSSAIDRESGENAVTRRLVIDRFIEMTRHFRAALEEMEGMTGRYVRRPYVTFNFHRDHRLAVINAMRAFLAICIAGWFWIESAWPTGSTMLTQVAVVCSLFSASPQPDKLGFSFLLGTLWAALASYICLFSFLNHLEGFIPLAVVLGLFLIPGGLAMYFPRFTGIGFAYTVNFIALLNPLNVMSYDISAFLNGTLAALAGVFLGTLAYQLFVPPDPHAERRYVIHRIRRGLEIISSRIPIPPALAWQTRMYDRVNRLFQPDNPSGTPTDEWYEEGLAALNLGNELIRVRTLAESGEGREVRPLLDAFSRAASHPREVCSALEQAQRRIAALPAPAEPARRQNFLRLQGALEEIHHYMQKYGILTPLRTEGST